MKVAHRRTLFGMPRAELVAATIRAVQMVKSADRHVSITAGQRAHIMSSSR